MEDTPIQAQDLAFAKYFTAGIAFLLLILGGGLWPFIWWDLYSHSQHSPPEQLGRMELHVVDTAGQTHVLRPMDLYTLDDDTSNQEPGHRLIRDAIAGTPQQQAIDRPYLVSQVEFVLNKEIEQVEVWNYTWAVDFQQHPPLDINQPQQITLIDRFSARP